LSDKTAKEKHMHRLVLVMGVLFISTGPASVAADKFFLKNKERVVFLGDSNTYAGLFIAYIDGYLVSRFPARSFELINLGLPSETVSGLSEPDHPYPRPDVHERLERVLAKTKPDVVVICYGMNDGIYSPFSEDRFKKYREGMHKLIARVKKAGARVVLMTPAPFDPLPLQGKTLAATAAKFSWMKPYRDYDDVLARYSAWLVTLRGKGFLVVDAHTAINRHLAERRQAMPQYFISGDGIHPNATGHRLVAEQILEAWSGPREVDTAVIDAKNKKANSGTISNVEVKAGTLRFTWRTRIPIASLAKSFNRHTLAVTGLADERYELVAGDKRLGEVTHKELAAGLDMTRFAELSTNRRSAELAKLAEERQRLLGPAWLTEVGHKRPDTPKGLPLAEAQRRASLVEGKMRILAQPTPVTLSLVPRRTHP
jgi:lysophospholipase L1-like esterase